MYIHIYIYIYIYPLEPSAIRPVDSPLTMRAFRTHAVTTFTTTTTTTTTATNVQTCRGPSAEGSCSLCNRAWQKEVQSTFKGSFFEIAPDPAQYLKSVLEKSDSRPSGDSVNPQTKNPQTKNTRV